MTFARLAALTVSLALLAPAAPASAHHWHDGDRNHDGHHWDNNQDVSQPTVWQPPTISQPNVVSQPGGGWNPNQGDAPETPQNWDPPRRPDRSNPWNTQPLETVKGVTVGGKLAKLRTNGKAAIPRGAPARVRSIIRAANAIIGKPYKWGGGHGRLFDSGYDCSGSVSYALIRAGQLSYPMVSGTFAHWAAHGKGKYVTIYANRGHVYMEVAGLRLDTSPVGDYRGKSGVRWRPLIGKRVGFAVRHLAGL